MLFSCFLIVLWTFLVWKNQKTFYSLSSIIACITKLRFSDKVTKIEEILLLVLTSHSTYVASKLRGRFFSNFVSSSEYRISTNICRDNYSFFEKISKNNGKLICGYINTSLKIHTWEIIPKFIMPAPSNNGRQYRFFSFSL